MTRARDPMKRHWVITVWKDDQGDPMWKPDLPAYDFGPGIESMIDTARLCGAHYVAWSIEDSRLKEGDSVIESGDPQGSPTRSAPKEDGGIHMHGYIECDRSIRWSTVRNRFQRIFQGAHVENRRGWRTSAREYNLGMRNGSEKIERITSGEWGTWREEISQDQGADDIQQDVARMIVDEGANPRSIAIRYPRWFIRNGLGTIRLWETINGQQWKQQGW